jgi:hypothetical protein
MKSTRFLLLGMASMLSGALAAQTNQLAALNGVEIYQTVQDHKHDVFQIGSVTGMITVGSDTVRTANDASDIFIAKYDANGNISWLKTFGGPKSDAGNKIVPLDSSGNIYVSGWFEDSIVFDTTVLHSKGRRDIFLAKFNADGQCLWAISKGNTGDDICDGIIIGSHESTCSIRGYYFAPESQFTNSEDIVSLGFGDFQSKGTFVAFMYDADTGTFMKTLSKQ